MKVVGLTGSIGMGKSEVAKIFREHGIPVFDSDAEVHKLYDSPEGADLIRPFVPEATTDSKVNREIITKHVLKDATLLAKLEPVVHAEIRKRRNAFIASAKNELVVLDIPLLFETGADNDVAVTLVVSAPAAEQRRRVLERPGMTEERFNLILSRQMPDQEKRKRANYVIENNGTLGDLKKSVEDLIKKLQGKTHA